MMALPSSETRTVSFLIGDRAYATLVEQARKRAMTPTMWAKLLFGAGFAARCGKADDDTALVAAVAGRDTGPVRSAPARTMTRVVGAPVPILVPVPIMVPVEVAVPVERETVAEPLPPPAPAAGEVAALMRTIRGMAAAGMTARAIAGRIGQPYRLVRDVMAGRITG